MAFGSRRVRARTGWTDSDRLRAKSDKVGSVRILADTSTNINDKNGMAVQWVGRLDEPLLMGGSSSLNQYIELLIEKANIINQAHWITESKHFS